MALAHLFLGVLGEGPSHGYDLKLRLDRRFTGSKPLPVAQVYATLGRLQRDGLVEVAEVTQDGGPERTVYAITAGGREVLDQWLATSEPAGPYPAGELARKAIVAIHLGADAVGYLQRQRAVHLTRMRELVRTRSQTRDPAARLGIEYAINHLDADLRWIDAAASTSVAAATSPAWPEPVAAERAGGPDGAAAEADARPEDTSRGGSRG